MQCNLMNRSFTVLAIAALLVGGCAPPDTADKPKEDTNIIGKTTQEVGEYDPDGAAEVQVDDGSNVNLITGAAGAYTPTISTISKLSIEKSLQLFEAIHERYPESHEEFMTEIIKKGGIQLPQLPAGQQYQYDVENHELVRVKLPKEE